MSISDRFWTIVGEGYAAASEYAEQKGDKYVSVGEVARFAKCSRPTARKYLVAAVKSGEIGGFFAAGMWFFNLAKDNEK